MEQWDMREQLARHIDAGKIKDANALLRERAKSYLDKAEAAGHDTFRVLAFEARAKWLLHSALRTREVAKLEKSIESQRREIKLLDGKLLKAVNALRDYLGQCAKLAAVLHAAGCDQFGYPLPQISRAPYTAGVGWGTPLEFLQAFSGIEPLAMAIVGARNGKPIDHKTIESERLKGWPFLFVAVPGEWQDYLMRSLAHYSTHLARASAMLLPGDLLALSEALDELAHDPFSTEVALRLCQKIDEFTVALSKAKEPISDKLSIIDAFYNRLAPCEENVFIHALNPPDLFTDARPLHLTSAMPPDPFSLATGI